MMIEMEKTKFIVLATTIVVLAVVVLVGAAFAQTSMHSQTPSTGVPTGTNGNTCVYNGNTCPGLNGYANGQAQNGCFGQSGTCAWGGMMGCYHR
jgi:hypothetical protein